ncbi:hypothetical protein FLK61_24480 [Paenalkalicoccus suaedae]|uniref:Uncharacterized protein n=1 Tax=Paenalkalicoccus suaedae TaxID=2592382 RepID=A0A859FAJ5_9BACI|nr:hypothetical protein [Paenalkalicoccus suaedae]QKS69940.1 hypothetical protein FLK61_24480 [Paenalkalicoccus suaedae]
MQLLGATGSLLFAAFTVIVGLGGIMLILSFFLKNRLVLVLVTLGIVSGIALLVINSQQSTFEEAYFDVTDEDVILHEARLTVNDVSDLVPERIMYLNIEDEETLEALSNDFMGIELREDNLRNRASEEYRLTFRVSYTVREGLRERHDMHLFVDDTHINSDVVSPPFAHLRTIEALINDESLDWVMEEDG